MANDETEIRELAESLYERDTGRDLAQADDRAREDYRRYALSILRVAHLWGGDDA